MTGPDRVAPQQEIGAATRKNDKLAPAATPAGPHGSPAANPATLTRHVTSPKRSCCRVRPWLRNNQYDAKFTADPRAPRQNQLTIGAMPAHFGPNKICISGSAAKMPNRRPGVRNK